MTTFAATTTNRLIIQILEHGTGTDAVVAQQFHGGAKFKQLNLLVQHLILQHPHDFKTGIVRTGHQTRLRTAAAFFHMQIAVGITSNSTPRLSNHLAIAGPSSTMVFRSWWSFFI